MNYYNYNCKVSARLFDKDPVELSENYYSTLLEEVEKFEKVFGGGLPDGLEETTLYDIIREKWNTLTTIGFTIDEFQKAMVFPPPNCYQILPHYFFERPIRLFFLDLCLLATAH